MKKVKILSKNCVNSKWTAHFVGFKGEFCQCGFLCKIRIKYKNYEYIVTEDELNEISK